MHVERKKPILFIGQAGTGKTSIIMEYINSIPQNSNLQNCVTNFSSKTSSHSL